jgi:hypothetical protein
MCVLFGVDSHHLMVGYSSILEGNPHCLQGGGGGWSTIVEYVFQMKEKQNEAN